MKVKNACFALSILFGASLGYAQVTGSGTTDYVPLWTGTGTLGDSAIFQTNGNLGINTKRPAAKLWVETSSATQPAIYGNISSTSGFEAAVQGQTASTSGTGVHGNDLSSGIGVYGSTVSGIGVLGTASATTGYNLAGSFSTASPGGTGLQTMSPNLAFSADNLICSTSCIFYPGTAGQFITGPGGFLLQGYVGPSLAEVFSVDSSGNLTIAGTLTKGGGSFKIDDPLDPANKYLSHSFVESPDMMNIYNGMELLDDKGEASVKLPDYFQALNGDFRYQLTAIGAPGPNLYVAEEISGNHFKIAGGKPGAKVSWQVTGIRQDAYAKAHPIPVEEDKPAAQRGHYLHPELFGATEKQSIGAANLRPKILPVPVAAINQGNLGIASGGSVPTPDNH